MNKKVEVIVIGCGNMRSSHARAYYKLEGFELVVLAADESFKTEKTINL